MFISVLLLTAVSAQQSDGTPPIHIDAVVTPRSPGSPAGACPANDVLQSVLNNITATVQMLLATLEFPTPAAEEVPACGEGGWRQVADLDMTDSSQQCPSPWVEVSLPAIVSRACTSSISTAGCEGVSFPVSGGTYSHVCGRADGYATGDVDAFADLFNLRNDNIDNPYLEGVSITHGSPRQHIWSLAAGYDQNNHFRCPCDNSDRSFAPFPPSFVGDNYFCDGVMNGNILWNGIGCTTACCTFNSPPYFSVSLPNPTSDAIEVRICTDQPSSDEAVHITTLQLFMILA